MSKKTLVIILSITIVLLIVLIGGKKAGWFGKSGNFKEVETKKIERLKIIETVSATGKIQPEVEVSITSDVSGEIIELNVVEGQQVQKGDLLLRINPDIYKSSLNRAQATLQNVKAGLSQADASLKETKANYERNLTLFEKGIISKADWDKVVSSYEIAEANRKSSYFVVQSSLASVNEAQNYLDRTTVFAPMSGTISKLDAEIGNRVLGTQQFMGTEIMRIANLNQMEVEVDVNENDIVKVHIGDSTNVEVDAYLKKEFKGIVTEISNSADGVLSADQVTNFKVKVRILEESFKDLLKGKPEHYSPFRPGMTATVDIITAISKNTLYAPISAIVIKTDTSSTKENARKEVADVAKENEEKFECVFIKKGDVAELRVVKTGIQDDTNIEITSGLNEGDEVITGPYNMVTKTLKSGDKVEIKKESSKEKSTND
ncbi:efflux RND transporter periplasmic adaptor subunit [Yeosuana sp.]|uniref:efflux RND transporter periplasmic adaptor subunit n=1 Tax=Yeosuana sp. TaxID=2529388 RepID=UPI0040553062|tara:strand:+ start:3754 stop:5049 length:1296 start_codon:yes stop_codon:yes gene_type:complete